MSFNAGELSPLLDARVDVDKYQNGCRKLENAMVLTYGGAERRPGLQFIAATKDETADAPPRLVEFQYSTSTAFVLELGEEYIRFYSNGAQVLSGPSAYEITSPWTLEQVFQLQYTQINDVMYVVHPDVAPHKISRITDTNWTCEEVEFEQPAFLDENVTDTTFTPSADTGTITVTASDPVFVAGMEGSTFQITYLRTDVSVRISITADGVSSSIRIDGGWRVRTSGIWDAALLLMRSYDNGGSWELVRAFNSVSDANYDQTGTEPLDALYRLEVVGWVSGSSSPKAILEIEDPYGRGYVTITGYTSPTVVDAEVTTQLFGTSATRYWAEGAWSAYRGYPQAVTLFEQRLCLAATAHQPQTVWGSGTGDYENFLLGTAATDPFAYTIGAHERNAIQWMVAQKALLIGTTSSEWSMQGESDEALTPTNVLVRRHSNYGSKAVGARLVNECVLFTQRQGKRIREMVFSFEKDGYVAPDLTLLAEHVTKNGILQTAYQQQDQSILWVVTLAGELVGMSYEREQSVVGWHRHTTVGLFQSVATIYGDEGDEVWVVVNREVDGAFRNYVERLNPAKWAELEDAFYIDSGLSYDGAPDTTFTGLDHLRGLEVVGLADGAPVGPFTVSAGGEVELEAAASKVHLGLPYTTVVWPMRLDSDPQAGVSQGVVKQIREVNVRLYRTLGLSYSTSIEDDPTSYTELPFRTTDDPMDAPPPLFTGEKQIPVFSDFDTDVPIRIAQFQPLPMTLLAIFVKYEITGN